MTPAIPIFPDSYSELSKPVTDVSRLHLPQSEAIFSPPPLARAASPNTGATMTPSRHTVSYRP
ncbi:MAG: hypothetical protein RMK99_16070 [Anaerolineales bacterium]|nr:hypothetical protein [Anaerolineales bacterium]